MRLSLIALLVPDYDAAIAFFTAIGFALVEDTPQDGKRWVVVRPPSGGSDILLARAAGTQRHVVGRQAGGRVGFFLTTTDMAGDMARIEGAGGIFEADPRCEPYGRVAVFRDPWGNRWDLIEPVAS